MARRPPDTRSAAEKAFNAATSKPPELPPKPPSLPGVKEMVSLRIDRDVLDFFQEEGPGWQERINAALRKTTRLPQLAGDRAPGLPRSRRSAQPRAKHVPIGGPHRYA
jgi:uncharacterized protein (DUF4415 family)